MLEVGIVGLPNVGKSTLFNALTRAHAAVSNYPFCTIEPNEAVVAVPDTRLSELASMFHQDKVVLATFKFADIAGLVRNAHRGEGLGNQFLSHIRRVDAVLHLVRCFSDPKVAHVEGSVDPVRDSEVVEMELTIADYEQAQRRLERVSKSARVGDKEAVTELKLMERIIDHLKNGNPVRTLSLSSEERTVLKPYQLLTQKPMLLVGNVDESSESQKAYEELQQWAEGKALMCLSINAKISADLSEFSEEEAMELAEEMGIETSALEEVVRACFQLVNAIVFFTAVGKEVTAWVIERGTTAVKAAGKIHSDMERGFIRAEVIPFDLLKEVGSWHDAHQRGLVKIKGKDYEVQDGDVILFRFDAHAGR